MAGIGAIIINFNTAELTLRCVASLLTEPGIAAILVLDNASEPADRARLAALPVDPRLRLRHSERNLGFAGGCNLALDELLREPALDRFLLLNSDAEAAPGMAERLSSALDPSRQIDLAGGRVMRLEAPDEIDSLGIAFYASCLASNRMRVDDVFFGPTGGCALYSRRLIEDLISSHGYFFDAEFFCYAEDTDVAARAILLGYVPAYVDAVVALHHGQASSGGGFNDFVLYHGIRNSVWMLLKDVPATVLLLYSPLILALHIAIAIRHALRRKAMVVWRLYRDAARGCARVLRQRRRIQASRRITARCFRRWVTPRFYDKAFLIEAVRDLLRR